MLRRAGWEGSTTQIQLSEQEQEEVNAAVRKLLVWAWAVFTSGQPFAATMTVGLAA